MKLKKLENYYKQALVVAENSPDEQTKVGSLLIHGKTGAVLSSGYNGFVRGAPDAKLPKKRPEKHSYIIHSEENLITNGFRHGIMSDGCLVFCTLSPCIKCLRLLYQSGITQVYFKDFYKDFDANINMLDIDINLVQTEGGFTLLTLSPRSI